MNSPEKGCPVDHVGATLLKHSFATVAESFAGFKSTHDHDKYTPRGGNARPQKKVRAHLAPTRQMLMGPGYGVESTFNEHQFAYVGITVAGLNKLLRGELMTPRTAGPAPKPFTDGVVTSFMNQERGSVSFGWAVAQNALRLYDDFGTFYPNMLPALKAMLRAGGGEGTDIALSASRDMLSAALKGEDPLADAPFLAQGVSAVSFTLEHPYFTNVKTHEVWCPGEAVAKGIIRGAGRAAVRLADMPGVAEYYQPGALDPVGKTQSSLSDLIEMHVRELYDFAA